MSRRPPPDESDERGAAAPLSVCGPRLLVVGSPSIDLLHFGGRSERSAGGAGLYTALAAQRAGAHVTVIAPRPDPMPPELVIAAASLDWVGPTVEPDRLPHFEIEYLPSGETVYHRAVQGSEGDVRFEHLPPLERGALAYVVPLIDPELQLAFARHLTAAGLRVACGAYRGGIRRHRAAVASVLDTAEFFFCNADEAALLFGRRPPGVAPGRVLFVTRGARGARVVQGTHATDVAPVAVEELDPTGAGDTFCGTALARIAQGDHPVMAARWAVAAAAEVVTGVGPERLLDPAPAPSPARDPRAQPDVGRIRAVARIVADAPEARPFDFTGPPYPEVGDPRALEFFFAATVQQFGFWTEREGRYEAPMIASLDGEPLKGSDFLWRAYRRWLDEAAGELAPAGQAELSRDRFERRLRDDSGRNPLPAADLHFAQAVAYGRDMRALGWTPADVVARIGANPRPLGALLRALDGVGGYKEDPWRKKSGLLALILAQRPERFLRPGPGEDAPPIVDYHCMRSCLRIGLVSVEDERLRARIAARELLDEPDEEAVRAACHAALMEVWRASGRPMGAVDWFFFQNRARCPEMTEPDCPACPVDPACAHRTELFQPVIRTPSY